MTDRWQFGQLWGKYILTNQHCACWWPSTFWVLGHLKAQQQSILVPYIFRSGAWKVKCCHVCFMHLSVRGQCNRFHIVGVYYCFKDIQYRMGFAHSCQELWKQPCGNLDRLYFYLPTELNVYAKYIYIERNVFKEVKKEMDKPIHKLRKLDDRQMFWNGNVSLHAFGFVTARNIQRYYTPRFISIRESPNLCVS